MYKTKYLYTQYAWYNSKLHSCTNIPSECDYNFDGAKEVGADAFGDRWIP